MPEGRFPAAHLGEPFPGGAAHELGKGRESRISRALCAPLCRLCGFLDAEGQVVCCIYEGLGLILA